MPRAIRSRNAIALLLLSMFLQSCVVSPANVPVRSANVQCWDQEEPQHGGVTNWNTNSEYSFELVVNGESAIIYVEDHEVPVDTSGAKGELTVTRNGSSQTAKLETDGDNRMMAGGLSIKGGDRVVARITLANSVIMLGRFIAK